MFSTSDSGQYSVSSAGFHVADGETFEIRYVDSAQAASWACERGFVLNPEDIPPAALAYFD
jgi:hypothetical protein